MTALPAAPGCRAEPLGPLTARPFILVCGGRAYADTVKVDEVLRLHVPPGAWVLEGGANGADRLAREWAFANSHPVWTAHAFWKRDGRAAGPLRNQRMLDDHKPALVIAFPGGRGTADMVKRAKAAGVPVVEVPA